MTRTIDHVELLRSSAKFQQWLPRPKRKRKPTGGVRTMLGDASIARNRSRDERSRGRDIVIAQDVQPRAQFTEQHYAPTELAQIWGVSVQTIREIFKAEEGVLKIGSDGTRNRRGYKTLRIPDSVAKRVHARLSE